MLIHIYMPSYHNYDDIYIIHISFILRHGDECVDRITCEAHISMLATVHWSVLQLIVSVVGLVYRRWIQVNVFLKQFEYSLTSQEVPNYYSTYTLLTSYWI